MTDLIRQALILGGCDMSHFDESKPRFSEELVMKDEVEHALDAGENIRIGTLRYDEADNKLESLYWGAWSALHCRVLNGDLSY